MGDKKAVMKEKDLINNISKGHSDEDIVLFSCKRLLIALFRAVALIAAL
ncbi:hypothetical protein [Acetobacterium woodii]|nr:hypothetical protein [Acetobacterium woodii]